MRRKQKAGVHWVTTPEEIAEFERKHGRLGTTLILGASARSASELPLTPGSASEAGEPPSAAGQTPAPTSATKYDPYSGLTRQQWDDMISAREKLQGWDPAKEKVPLDDLLHLLLAASGDRTVLNPTETDLEWLEQIGAI